MFPLSLGWYLRESIEVLHPVQRRAHDHLQDHAVVWHPPLLVVVHIVLSPVAYDAELLDSR
jgi:hypothetical protein